MNDLQFEIQQLRNEKRELLAMYGRDGRRHPTAHLIGGLNPAGQRLAWLTSRIRELTPKKTKIIQWVRPLGNYTQASRNLPQGLCFDVRTAFASYKVGKDNHGKFYIVKDGGIISEDHATVGKALKAVEAHEKGMYQ